MDDTQKKTEKEEKDFISKEKVNEETIDPGNEHTHLEGAESSKSIPDEQKESTNSQK